MNVREALHIVITSFEGSGWVEAQNFTDAELIEYVISTHERETFAEAETDLDRAMYIILDKSVSIDVAVELASAEADALEAEEGAHEIDWDADFINVDSVGRRTRFICKCGREFKTSQGRGLHIAAVARQRHARWSRNCDEIVASLRAVTKPHAAPVAAPRDWNDESKRVVATYKSDIGDRGYNLHSEPIDSGDYRPYSRIGARA